MGLKNIFIFVSIFCNIYCFYPYFKDIYWGNTKPHIYTWLIWLISQSVSFIVIIRAGGGVGSYIVLVNCVLIAVTFLLSFKYGTKNINNFDKLCLVLALVTICSYLYFINPVISLLFAVATDILGYFPTLRKVKQEPKSENETFYIISVCSNILMFLSLETYVFNTWFYPLSMAVINFLTFAIIFAGKKRLKNVVK